METDITLYENLAQAIVVQATLDYKAALLAVDRNQNDYWAKKDIMQLERFFRSAWFRTLTEIDGEYLMMKIQEGANIRRKAMYYGDYKNQVSSGNPED